MVPGRRVSRRIACAASHWGQAWGVLVESVCAAVPPRVRVLVGILRLRSQRHPRWSVQCGQELANAIKRWRLAIANGAGDIIDGSIAQIAAFRFQRSGRIALPADRSCTHREQTVGTVHQAMMLLPTVMMIPGGPSSEPGLKQSCTLLS